MSKRLLDNFPELSPTITPVCPKLIQNQLTKRKIKQIFGKIRELVLRKPQ